MSGYEFDIEGLKLKKGVNSVWSIIRKVLGWVFVSLSMAIFYYAIVSLVFSTETERRLKRENKMYELLYPELSAKEELLSDVVENLTIRDNGIYSDIFGSSAPALDPSGVVSLDYNNDTIVERNIIVSNTKRLESVSESVDDVEGNFMELFSILAKTGTVMPPMGVPVEGFSYAKTGASIGQRISPFYKIMSSHNGLDIMAAQGDNVLAAGDGIVEEVIRSAKGQGNVVVINHGDGYVTRYAHLADIVVRKGQQVKLGSKLAVVGVTGNTFAPHLHYEILKDGAYIDPVNYLFDGLTPEDYANVVYLSSSTGQSMD